MPPRPVFSVGGSCTAGQSKAKPRREIQKAMRRETGGGSDGEGSGGDGGGGGGSGGEILMHRTATISA